MVKPKKHLGQHFLKDDNIARKIARQLSGHGNYKQVIEIGAGTGVLSRFLLELPYTVYLLDIDRESIAYLQEHYPGLHAQGRIIFDDFLKMDLHPYLQEPVAIAGNFPYNISSQIFFRVLQHRRQIPEVVCMIQKEVAERLAAPPGNKSYGILSVLLQRFYKIEYCFTVPPHVFLPPPKVQSAVIRLQALEGEALRCEEHFYHVVVKAAFNQRRKTLRNALKALLPPGATHEFLSRRAEQLSPREFEELCVWLERLKKQ